MKLYLSIIFLILLYIQSLAGISLTQKEFYFRKVKICDTEFFNNLQESLVYELNNIVYLKIFPYKTKIVPENATPIDVVITKCNKNEQFKLKFIVDKVEKVFNSRDVNFVVEKIVEFLKNKYPLTGIIIKSDNNDVILNIGINYNVKKGDKFVVLKNNEIIAHLLILKVFSTYAEAKITYSSMPVTVEDTVIKVTYDLLEKLVFKYKCDIKNINKKFLLRDKSKNFKVINYKNNIFIARYFESGIYNLLNNQYIKVDDVGYNKIKKVIFSINEAFVGYSDDLNRLTIIDLINYTKFFIKYNPDDNKYYLLSDSDTKYIKLKDIKIGAFRFYKNNIIFFDSERKKLIEFNLLKHTYFEYKLKNIDDIKEIDSIFITGNKERLIVRYISNNQNLLIKNLITDDEVILTNIKYYLCDYVEANIIYIKDNAIFLYNMYLNNITKLFSVSEVINNIRLSISERYLLFYNLNNPNELNIYDFKNRKVTKDIFRTGKIKHIKNVWWMNNSDVLLFGRLKDDDGNNKIDYRDSYRLIRFSINTGISRDFNIKLDEIYNYTNYGNFILYKYRDALYLLRCSNGKE